jgi:hypothetical protein
MKPWLLFNPFLTLAPSSYPVNACRRIPTLRPVPIPKTTLRSYLMLMSSSYLSTSCRLRLRANRGLFIVIWTQETQRHMTAIFFCIRQLALFLTLQASISSTCLPYLPLLPLSFINVSLLASYRIKKLRQSPSHPFTVTTTTAPHEDSKVCLSEIGESSLKLAKHAARNRVISWMCYCSPLGKVRYCYSRAAGIPERGPDGN